MNTCIPPWNENDTRLFLPFPDTAFPFLVESPLAVSLDKMAPAMIEPYLRALKEHEQQIWKEKGKD
jgi:hypothetical protein